MNNAITNPLAMEICDEALTLPDAQRLAWVNKRCGDDDDLRTMVTQLITSITEAEKVLTTGGAFQRVTTDLVGKVINGYQIQAQLGQGGMGIVYLAVRQQQDVAHRVALKMINQGLMNSDTLKRFVTEQKALARLHHPYISSFIEMGVTEDGIPYYVMEYVEGKDILKFADDNRLSIADRIGLWRKVCDAVQSSHRNLVLHRDIKPTNIIVQQDGLPKLVDFGVAKLIEEGNDLDQTQAIGANLTLDYASPERIMRGQSSTMDDQYSLVVLLHELIVGARPFNRGAQSLAELVDEVEHHTVNSLNDTYASLAAHQQDRIAELRSTAPRSLRSVLNSDMNAIVVKGLHPDPEQRYPSIDALLTDVHRYQSQMPVAAKQPTLTYRLQRYLRRNRIPVGAAASILLILATALYFSILQIQETNRQLYRAQATANFMSQIISAPSTRWNSSLRMGPDASMQEVLTTAAAELDESKAIAPEIKAQLHLSLADAFMAWGLNEKSLLESRRALAITRQYLPAEHRLQEQTRTGLAINLDMNNQSLDEARGYILESKAWLEKYAPDDSLRRTTVIGELGYNAARRGDRQQAIENYQTALAHWHQGGGASSHPIVALGNGLLGQAYYANGDLSQAETHWQQARAILQALPGVAMIEWSATYHGLFKIAVLTGDRQGLMQIADDIIAMKELAPSQDINANSLLTRAAYAYVLCGDLARAEAAMNAIAYADLPQIHADFAEGVRAFLLHTHDRNAEAWNGFASVMERIERDQPAIQFLFYPPMVDTARELGLLKEAHETAQAAEQTRPAQLSQSSLLATRWRSTREQLATASADQSVSSE
ncbi:MAG: serine/threonine-protein kinase [Pseudomonadales bacterium]